MSETEQNWHELQAKLLKRAKRLRSQAVVDREEFASLQADIRALEQRADRPVLSEINASGYEAAITSIDRPKRLPTFIHGHAWRPCLLGECDGSGWHLDEDLDVATPCGCQEARKDPHRRQTRRILKRHLAPSLDAPPVSFADHGVLQASRDFRDNMKRRVSSGMGLWLAGVEQSEAICGSLATDAIRNGYSVAMYPGDELVGRLRRLASMKEGPEDFLDSEIYDRLVDVDLLVITGLDTPLISSRYPEKILDRSRDTEHGSSCYEPALTGNDLDRLTNVFDQRMMESRPVILTTSLDIPSLKKSLARIPKLTPSSGSDNRLGEPFGPQTHAEHELRTSEIGRLLTRVMATSGEPIVEDAAVGEKVWRPTG